MTDYEHLLVKSDGDTVRITMNRPDRRNSLSEPHLRELLDAFETAGRSDATGIVLAGEGKAFSPGTISPTWPLATWPASATC